MTYYCLLHVSKSVCLCMFIAIVLRLLLLAGSFILLQIRNFLFLQVADAVPLDFASKKRHAEEAGLN